MAGPIAFFGGDKDDDLIDIETAAHAAQRSLSSARRLLRFYESYPDPNDARRRLYRLTDVSEIQKRPKDSDG